MKVLLIEARHSEQDLSFILRGEGFEVQSVSTLEEARRCLSYPPSDAEHYCAVIVMDLLVEDGESYQLFEEDFDLENRIVLGIMGVLQGRMVRFLISERYGFKGLLDKPINGALLVDLLREALGKAYPQPSGSRALRERLTEIFNRHFERVLTGQRPSHLSLPKVLPRIPKSLDWHRIPDQGKLSSISFPALLTKLLRIRFMGALRIWSPQIRKLIYFNDGCPTGSRSDLYFEDLGYLIKTFLSEVENLDMEREADQAQRAGMRLGEWLIHRGLLSPSQLDDALSEQLEMRILNIFGWHGEVSYQIRTLQEIEYSAPMDPEQSVNLIIDGVLSYMSLERVMWDLEPYLHDRVVPLVSEYHFEDIRIPLNQREMIKMIFQTQGSLLELVAHFEESAQAYQTIYALVALGYIEFRA